MAKLNFLLLVVFLLSTCLYYINAIPVSTPEEVNLNRKKLDLVSSKLKNLVDADRLPGVSFLLLRSGKAVYSFNYGSLSDSEVRRDPYRVDTICRLMSMSKPVAAAAFMVLVEDGLVKLDDPVYKYIPKFKNMRVYVSGSGRNMRTEPLDHDPTILELLTHTSGLTYGPNFGDATPVDMLVNTAGLPFMNYDEFEDHITSIPLLYQPGLKWHYSLSYDVLGLIMAKVTGQSPDIFMNERLFKPLGMKDTGFYVPEEKLNRFSTSFQPFNVPFYGETLVPVTIPTSRIGDMQSYEPPVFISLGAGLVSTALDFARFGEMLLQNGELDGVRVFKEETVEMMWTNYMTPDQLPMDLMGWISDEKTGFGIGFTVSVNDDINKVDFSKIHGVEYKEGNVAWGGGQMTNWQANADGDFVAVFMTQRFEDIGVFHDMIIPGIWDAIEGQSPRQEIYAAKRAADKALMQSKILDRYEGRITAGKQSNQPQVVETEAFTGEVEHNRRETDQFASLSRRDESMFMKGKKQKQYVHLNQPVWKTDAMYNAEFYDSFTKSFSNSKVNGNIGPLANSWEEIVLESNLDQRSRRLASQREKNPSTLDKEASDSMTTSPKKLRSH